jgi:hypothetical protein
MEAYTKIMKMKKYKAMLAKNRKIKRPFRHGMSHTGVYHSYTCMKYRCLNPSSKCYDNYGGRGIGICKPWIESFYNFFDDMGHRPDGYTLERINTNRGYSKKNCIWATREENLNNRRISIKVGDIHNGWENQSRDKTSKKYTAICQGCKKTKTATNFRKWKACKCKL